MVSRTVSRLDQRPHAVRKGVSGATLAIVAETPYQYHIDRPTLAGLLPLPGAPRRFGPMPRIVPTMIDQDLFGVHLFSVRAGSLAARLGLKSGDTVRSVQGVKLRWEESLLAVYKRLRTANVRRR